MDIPALIASQRAYFSTGFTRSLEFRRASLRKLHDALEGNESRLFDALQGDLHKSRSEAYSTEIGLVLSELRHSIAKLHRWMKPRAGRMPLLAWPARGWVQPEPFGVTLILGPWNYPVQLILVPLAGAIAAGNTAVLKPSELSPRTSAVIAEMIGQTFPQEHIAAVEGDHTTAESLLREKFEKIFFTGSTNVGKLIMAAAAPNLTPVTLELGGKSPCVVCADAPLKLSARRIAWGKFLNAGQTCVAPDYVLVDRRVRDAFLGELRTTLREFFGENPRHSAEFGRIINGRHFDRLVGYLSAGQIYLGGQIDADDLYIAPTVLTDVGPDEPVMRDEIFGPILPVIEFGDLDAALATLRNRPTPLAFYIFTADRSVQRHVLTQTRSGGACINDTVTQMIGKNLPFGGLGDSGIGSYHGRASFDCFSHYRAVVRRSLRFDPRFRYPPPKVTLKTLRRAYRFLIGA